MNRQEVVTLFLILLAFFSMLPNLTVLEPRGDEPLRLTLAYEMFIRGDYIQPTRLGDLYFNKPPMFMWLVVLFSKVVGWNILTVRLISVIFTLLTSFFVLLFAYRVFKNLFLGLVAGLSFITFADVLFYYGYLGEIDATYTFFVAVMMFSIYFGFSKEKSVYIILAGFLAGIIFLFKGYNAYGFYGLTILALSIYYRDYLKLFSKEFIISYIISILVPALWLIQTADPIKYLQTMFFEVSSRAEGSKDIKKFFTHLISFPLQNIKQTLLTSLLVIFVLIRYRVKILKHPIKAFLLILLLNYIPYLIFAGGKGMYTVDARYVVPLFPLTAVVFAYILVRVKREWVIKAFLTLVVISIILRLIYGLVVFPKKAEKDGSLERISADIVSIIDKNQKIACACRQYKGICFFLERDTGKIVGYPHVYPDWKYLVTCSSYREGKLIKNYKYKGGKIELYER